MRVTLPNPLGEPITFDSADSPGLAVIPPLALFTRSSSLIGFSRRPHFKIVLFLIGFVFLLTWHPSPPFPPSYDEEWAWEKAAVDEIGVTGRMVQFDIPKGTGFNHQLQRVLWVCMSSSHSWQWCRLQHHIAVLGNRSLSFEPYYEDQTFLPFSPGRWPWRSARIPLSAFISTVVSGFETLYNSPRAIPSVYSHTFWDWQKMVDFISWLNAVADRGTTVINVQHPKKKYTLSAQNPTLMAI